MTYFPTQRLPRLASATPPRTSATIVTPVRKRLRTFVQAKQRSGTEQALFELEELERYVSADHTNYSSLSVEMVKADLGNNRLKSFLIITRKLKSYDEQLGPYDAFRLIINDDGSYKLLGFGKALEENAIIPPINASCILQTLSQLVDESLVACPGIKGYSAFKESIGFDISRVVVDNCPPDSARDRECTILYKRQTTSKSVNCTNCAALNWQLTKRRKEHDGMPASKRVKRQSSSSSVPFNVLSPNSQQARVGNMRRTIKTLQLKSDYYSKRVERLVANDIQNMEIGTLVDTIVSSQDG